MNLLFALSGLYPSILKTEEMSQFWDEKLLVIPARKVN